MKSPLSLWLTFGFWLALAPISTVSAQKLPRLKVADNRRYLATETGQPFFYLGDTAWELLHRLTLQEAEEYLKDRSAKRFTVIQTVILAELDGLNEPNANGHRPLKNNDPTQPNEDYFRHVDAVLDLAEKHGLYVGLLPTWGDKVPPKKWGVGPEIFDPKNAEVYGRYLGQRYKDRAILWILGGDRNPETESQQAVWRAMARGLRQGDEGKHLITYHPSGGRSSAEWFHNEDWLDFHFQQNGHHADVPVWERMARDYARTPIKPVMDGEPLYEDHPLSFKAQQFGYANAADIRKFAYWDVFSGACGHTYGNHAIWQCYDRQRKPVNGPLRTWREALSAVGAGQMQHLRALVESRPYFSRIPDAKLIVSNPWAGGKRLVACRDTAGTYVMVYSPASRPMTIDLSTLQAKMVRAWWFDPRTGRATLIGEQANRGATPFTPPDEGENRDWVLVVDAVSAGYAAPGTPMTQPHRDR